MVHSGKRSLSLEQLSHLYTSSHLWENFVREARNGHEWLHEKSSIDILQFIIEENNLMPIFHSHGLTDNDITFVKVTDTCVSLIPGLMVSLSGTDLRALPAGIR